MPISCPNVKLKVWKDLVKAQGENKAYAIWNEYEGSVPQEYYNTVLEDVADLMPVENSKQNLISKMSREYKAMTTFYNSYKIPKQLRFNVKNKNVQLALVPGKNSYIPQIDSYNKKYIVSKYFRLRDRSGNKPFYPFSTGDYNLDIKLVQFINEEFGEKVVTRNDHLGAIVFTGAVDNAMSIKEKIETVLDYEDITIRDLDVDLLAKEESKLQAYEEAIARKRSLVQLLSRKITAKAVNVPETKARIDRLKLQIKELEDSKLNIEVDKVANDDLKEVNDRLDEIDANLYKDLNEDQLNDVISNLKELDAYIQGWLDINEMRDVTMITNDEIKGKIFQLSGGFSEARIRYLDLLKKAVLNYSNKVSYKKFTHDDLYSTIADENAVLSQVLGAQMSNVDLIQITQDLLHKAAFAQHDEQVSLDKELNDWIERLQKHTGLKSKLEISEKFLQYDSDGKWTGNLIGRIDQKFFNKRRELQQNAKKTGDWGSYFAFLNKNTYNITEAEYNTWLKAKESGKPIDYSRISTQRNSNGELLFVEKDFLKQEELLQKYNDHLEKFKEQILNTGKYGPYEMVDGQPVFEITQLSDDYYRDLDLWKERAYPWQKKGRQYFSKYQIRDKVDSKWFDKKYETVMSDPVLKEFYEYFKARSVANDELLPYYEKHQSNGLLSTRKTALEEFTESKGYRKTLGLVSDELMKTWTSEIDEVIERSVEIGGKLYKNIPVSLLHTELKPEEKSKNIFDILNKQNHLALAYKHKSEVEPIATAIQDILEDMDAGTAISSKGEKILKKNILERVFGARGGLVNARKRLEFLINSELYGKRKKEEGKGKKVHKLSTGEERVASASQTIDSLIKYTYVKALGIPNIISPAVNLGTGIVNNFIFASAGVDISDKSLMQAYGKMFSKTLNKAEKEKITTFVSRFKLLDDINTANYTDAKQWDKMFTILQSQGEYFNQTATALAYLLKNKVKDKKGNLVSLYDAFIAKDGELIWDVDKLGEMSPTETDEVISKDQKGVNMYRLSRLLKGINHEIHGDYESALKVKETMLGRAVMLFKTWIGQTVHHRFGAEHYNPNLMRKTKGRYRSMFKSTTAEEVELKFKQILPLMLKAIVSRKSLNGLSELDRVNLIRDVREFKMLVGLTLTAMLLISIQGGYDDDEYAKRMLNLAINMTTRLSSDLNFYTNPNSMIVMVNNGLPILKTMADFVAIAPAIYDTFTGDPVYKNGPWKDHSRLLVTTGKALPGFGGSIKMWNYATNRYDF
jgi:hypothetical protein